MANFPAVQSLSVRCPGCSAQHLHDRAWGSRRVDGQLVSLAASAGRYPEALRQALAQQVAQLRPGR
eukprot:521022-Alexandrium_andersonii.AAC.1